MKKSELRKLIRQSILESHLQEREKLDGKGGCKPDDPKYCNKDQDCQGTYSGHCCQNNCCSQCVTYEKPPRKDPHKSLEEQVQEGDAVCWDPCANNYVSPLTDPTGFGNFTAGGVFSGGMTEVGDCSGQTSLIGGSNSVINVINMIGESPNMQAFCENTSQYDMLITNHPTIDFSCCTYDRPVKPPTSPVRPGKPQTSPVRKPKPTRPSTSPANRRPKPPTSPMGSNPTKGKSGCTDSNACNYLASAVIDDGSCEYCHMNDCTMYPPNEYDCNGMPTM